MGAMNALKARMVCGAAAAGAAGVMAMGAVPAAAPAAAATLPTLAGETLNATIAHDRFSASCWTSGTYTVTFTFRGDATGPYPGRFTESGTITYALHRYLHRNDGAVAWARITAFSDAFTITSPAGTVTGATRLASRLPGEPEANCGGGMGGQALGAGVGTRYTATITTPAGTRQDRGPATAVLAGVNTGNRRFHTSLAEGFGAPASAPVNTAPPSIAGSSVPVVSVSAGERLTAFQPSWDDDPIAFAYRWLRCDAAGANCAPIPGATARSYTPQAADVGSTIRVQQWASNAAGTAGPAISDPTGVIASPPPSAARKASKRRRHGACRTSYRRSMMAAVTSPPVARPPTSGVQIPSAHTA